MPDDRDPMMLHVPNMTSSNGVDKQTLPEVDLGLDPSFSWEMIGLGLEEPMPMQEAIDELYVNSLLYCLCTHLFQDASIFR